MNATAGHGLSADELIEPTTLVKAIGGPWGYVGVRRLDVGARDHVFDHAGSDILLTVSREPVENAATDGYAYHVAAREASNPADTLLVVRPDELGVESVTQAVTGMALLIDRESDS